MRSLELLIHVPPAKLGELQQTLRTFWWDTGNPKPSSDVTRSLYRSFGDPDLLLWVERWPDQASFEAYLGSDAYKTLLGAVTVLGELREIRELADKNPSSTPNRTIHEAESIQVRTKPEERNS